MALRLQENHFGVAVSIITGWQKRKITLDDLAGENLGAAKRGWSYYGDMLWDDMMKKSSLDQYCRL